MHRSYVHGYDAREAERLHAQAETLQDLLHHGTTYPAGAQVLEAGCGTGSQTLALAARSPHAHFTCVDISASSLHLARTRAHAAGLRNVTFIEADVLALPFEPASFDHVFVCFVLEHLARPVQALQTLRRLMTPGGTITVIEGDHGSALFHPDSAAARRAIEAQVRLQAAAGGNALIGRQLYPLLVEAGFDAPSVSPRLVHVDGSRPAWIEGFTRNTFNAMIEGVRGSAIAAGISTADDFDAGMRDLHRTEQADGVFCYTFFKAIATAPANGPRS